MHLDPDRCYAALKSRDHRFDGRFFVGVLSTGVYCRPVCPARTPNRENVRFLPSAAAAQAAGFRACLRCRPETAPGTPAWNGTAATVSRALRLIDEGALDERSVGDLADRLGVGERHLRRLFAQHLGASPVAVAQTRRLHTTRALLLDTGLAMGEVAHLSGFSSVRRFNAAVKAAFGRSPSALREGRAPSATLRLRLSYRPPLAWASLLAFLAARAPEGLVRIEDGAYTRIVDGHPVRVRDDPGESCLWLEVPVALAPRVPDLVRRMRRLFDLDADPAAISEVLSRDPMLAERVRALPGLRVPGAFDPFEVAVRAVLGQQVSVAAATTLMGRLVARWGLSREALAEAPLEEIGLPGARAETLRGLARADLDFDTRASLDATVTALTALRGIGPWTAHYLAMRAFGEPDAWPESDLGLRRAGAIAERASAWRPWRAYAALYLWST